ncbi:furin-1-like isoform X2 [Halichondria panicea]|uniref:furin-1-like isoform X2 n=1 Tax=Halichondria panicea TaxID=6063 RepID=UPI00312B4A4D
MKLFLCVLVPLLCPRLSHGSTLLEAVREAVQMMEVPSDYWAVQVHGGASKATQLAHKHRLQLLGTIGNLADYYHLKLLPIANTANSVSGGGSGLSVLLEQEQEVGYVKQQSVRGMSSRQYSPSPTDPLWPQQWSLMSGGGLQVESVWRDGITGDSVVVAIVDDGLERTHPDLTDNYDPAASYDYVDYDLDPSPKGEDHGTSCAGIIAMARDNSRCGVGVAYNCSIGGVRINVSSISDALEASALGHHNSYVDVYSASWGPPDVGFWVSGPGPLTTNTLKASVHYGRSGKGSVYVWASGNGGAYYDSCAADGYASSIYTIAVGSVNRDGTPANYDEQCAAKMAVTFSHSKDNQQVVSSSGNGGCTDSFTGTSAATPLAAGVIALTLQANPQLTWRDIQHLLALTANTTSLTDGDWTTNGRGINVSHKFGFGAVDAVAMVTSARTWTNVPEQLSQIIYSSTRTRCVWSSYSTVSEQELLVIVLPSA